MDAFRQCVEDLGTIDRLLELPHGREIAVRLFRESEPYLELLEAMKGRAPTGAIRQVVEFADGLRRRIGVDEPRMTA